MGGYEGGQKGESKGTGEERGEMEKGRGGGLKEKRVIGKSKTEEKRMGLKEEGEIGMGKAEVA